MQKTNNSSEYLEPSRLLLCTIQVWRTFLTAWKVSRYEVFSGTYSVRMRENTDQKKLFGQFSRSDCVPKSVESFENI